MHFSDVVGLTGVVAILIAYLLLQLSVIKIEDYSYSIVNAAGSLLILYSLFFDWNFSAVVIEVAWFFISLYGIFHAWRMRRKARPQP
ncbi:MAG TPA: hypothetical protein VLG76_02350 [Rhabdochlamydiaceae bacterium]|nr:hypothetical protein [Rhabdochlamydiaceae bacterium]